MKYCRIRVSWFLPCLWMLIAVGNSNSAKGDDAAQFAEKLQRWQTTYDAEILSILQSRCWDCHNDDNAEGEFSLSKFSSGEAAAAQLDLWDRVGKRIRLNEMPPQGSPGLSDPQKGALQRWLDSRPQEDHCNQLASDETQSWYRGYVMSRRLTAIEYSNAIEDLLGISLRQSVRQPSSIAIDLPFELPADGAGGEGFDTVGDTLFTSAVHLEVYLRIANAVVDRALEVTADSPTTGAEKVSLALDANASDEAIIAVVTEFARRAWRRPLEAEEQQRLAELVTVGRNQQLTAQQTLALPLKAILVSPHFLFVVERQRSDGVQPLSEHELATRLALFLWSSVPDATLLDLADSGRLSDDGVIREQVRRMLADRRARSLGEHFGLQWIGISDLRRKVQPDGDVFPEFKPGMVDSMREEAIRTLTHVFQADVSLDDLLSAPYVHVNRELADLYGLEYPADSTSSDDASSTWTTIPITDGRRGGLLTMASVLASTSYPRRTSPVLRGQWILAEVLGSAVPPPPPGVPPLDEHAEADQPQTLRQRLEIHRQKPECASCHDRMDPLGFGLENYDALGRWREIDAGLPIDASGRLPSGQTFSNPAELKQAVSARRDEFRRNFIRKLLGFALGRELNKFDDCVIEDCQKALAANDGRAAAVVETICLSYPFRHRFFSPAE